MTLKSLIEKQQSGFTQAQISLNESLNALRQFAVTTQDGKITESDYRGLQLVLQYRLSSQDALRALLHYQQNLWQILGVSASASDAVSFERLAYALGNDDLHFLLTTLNQLADALLKLVGRMEAKNENNRRQSLKRKKEKDNQIVKTETKGYIFLKTAITQQSKFAVEILDLTQSLQVIAGAPEIGEFLDYIGVLEGPISHVYQALQNGLILAGSLYQQLSVGLSLVPELKQVIEEVHQALELSVPHLEQQRFFAPDKVNRLSGQNLEERATLKRSRPFF